MNQVRLSIVIASCNGRDDLNRCLTSISAGSLSDAETIVVENGSSDGTREMLRNRYPNVTIIENSNNLGHCRAINQGLRYARGEYILVLDADTEVSRDALNTLIGFFQTHPETVIAAPRMLNQDGSLQETARRFPTIMNAFFGRQSLLTRLFPSNPYSKKYLYREIVSADEPFEVDWVSSAAMMFPRSLTDKLGFWDESFNGYWVDCDWCRTAKQVGTAYCVPSARITHLEKYHRGQKKGASRLIAFHKGVYNYYRKHYTSGSLDLRALMAGGALALRAGFLILVDLLRSRKSPLSATDSHCFEPRQNACKSQSGSEVGP